MPARLFEPFSAAACEEKYERSESPGVAEKLNRSMVMSKSKSSTARAVLHRIDEAQGGVDAEHRRDS